MAWQWLQAGLAVEGLFDDGQWHSGVIQKCHYRDKSGVQTAEVYQVEVQWNGGGSQSILPVQKVRLRRTKELSINGYIGPLGRPSDQGAASVPWRYDPLPEVPGSTKELSSNAYVGPLGRPSDHAAFEAKCMACPWHERRTWHDGSSWWWCTLCDCWSAESHIVCTKSQKVGAVGAE